MRQLQVKKGVSREITKKTWSKIKTKLSLMPIVEKTRCESCKCLIYFDHFKESIDEAQLCQICEEIYE